MNEIQFPPFLQSEDKIGITAPASVIRYEDILPGIHLFTESWGLEVIEGKTLRSSYNQFSDTDENRLAEFQQMLDDPSVKAIIAARGGYGCSRIVDRLDFSQFLKSPKWIVGFSDLTVFLSRIYKLGYASIHAPMAKSISTEGGALAAESLKQMLFGELPSYAIAAHDFNRPGTANAEVVGGNLCMLAHMIGTETELDTSGKILFIEDIGEYFYNLDRMMLQMKRSEKLENLAGLIVGQFTEMKDNTQPTFGKNANEIIQEHVAGYNYPVCFDFPVGHVADNRAMGIGMHAALEVKETIVDFRFLPSAQTII